MRQRSAGTGRAWQSHALLALPLVLILLVVAVDVTTPPEIHMGALLVAAPVVTALFAGPGPTAAIGVLALIAELVIGSHRNDLAGQNRQAQIVALVLVCAATVVYARLRERHNRQLIQVRSVSEAAQQVVLRPLPTRSGPLLIASLYLSAQAEARIGGDLYAAARTAAGTRLMVGDVRGKGLAAIGDAALLMGAFRAAAHRRLGLTELAPYLDRCAHLDPGEAEEDTDEAFTTAVVVDIPDEGHRAWMVDCGHPPPLLLRGGEAVLLEAPRPAPPLGLGELAGDRYPLTGFDLLPGDVLLLYTDGVIEARDAAGGFYPLAERLPAWAGLCPTELLGSLRDDLCAHVGGHLGDDVAVVAVLRLPPG